MLRKLWLSLPEATVKSRLRDTFHNLSQRGVARYSRDGDIYVLKTSAFLLRSGQPSYDIPAMLAQFQHQHKILPGEVVIDAGAFAGVLTNAFARLVGPEGRVLAVEPDALSRARILRNLALNGDPPNVEVISEGLWDSPGEVEFCERGALGSSAFWQGPGGHQVLIHTTTLDSLVSSRGLSRLDFIKMNIEGAEIKALHGAANTIRRFMPHIAISTDHFVDGDVVSGRRTCPIVEEILKGYGYSVTTRTFAQEWVTFGTPSR